ncbi:hypothetical protein V6N12_054203 [Hibiscus sabdariffa]|uniref:Uncharacterized protein n=1 Tax=Hibiscus sabdariffa TaxID=183260 RepID=A0ABR2ATU1_9ROSI
MPLAAAWLRLATEVLGLPSAHVCGFPSALRGFCVSSSPWPRPLSESHPLCASVALDALASPLSSKNRLGSALPRTSHALLPHTAASATGLCTGLVACSVRPLRACLALLGVLPSILWCLPLLHTPIYAFSAPRCTPTGPSAPGLIAHPCACPCRTLLRVPRPSHA